MQHVPIVQYGSGDGGSSSLYGAGHCNGDPLNQNLNYLNARCIGNEGAYQSISSRFSALEAQVSNSHSLLHQKLTIYEETIRSVRQHNELLVTRIQNLEDSQKATNDTLATIKNSVTNVVNYIGVLGRQLPGFFIKLLMIIKGENNYGQPATETDRTRLGSEFENIPLLT